MESTCKTFVYLDVVAVGPLQLTVIAFKARCYFAGANEGIKVDEKVYYE